MGTFDGFENNAVVHSIDEDLVVEHDSVGAQREPIGVAHNIADQRFDIRSERDLHGT